MHLKCLILEILCDNPICILEVLVKSTKLAVGSIGDILTEILQDYSLSIYMMRKTCTELVSLS